MEKNRIISLALMIILVASLVTGCKTETKDEQIEPVAQTDQNNDEYGVRIEDGKVFFTDARGKEIELDQNPERVIILLGSFVDIWMNHGGNLVGMAEPSSDDILSGTEDIEKVGNQASISLEKVLSLEPDLVILSANTRTQVELLPSFEENGIQTLVFDYQYKEDYFKIARVFAAINDKMDLFEQEAQKVREKTEEIIQRAPKDKDIKALIIMATKNKIAARTSDTTIGEMFKDLNVINIADTSNGVLSQQSFSLEKIIEEDPDFIFVQTMGSDLEAIEQRIKSDAESNPAWASLSAVKNNRYIVLPKDLYTYKANHRYAEAYEKLAKILYPEEFK